MQKTWTLIGLSLNTTKLKNFHSSFLIDNIETNDRSVVADKFNNLFVNIGKNVSASIPAVFKSFLYLCQISIRGIKFIS